MQSVFQILTVCTGNVCRSPTAERLLQAGFDRPSPGSFVVRSAGTGALSGSPMTPQVAGLIRVMGGDPNGFISRQLTPDILSEFDLILALSREHKSRVLELDPKLLNRTFTLREAGRIVSLVGSQANYSWPTEPYRRWTELIEVAKRSRYEARPRKAEEDDVVDPYRCGDSVYQQMLRELTPSINALIAFEQRQADRIVLTKGGNRR